MRICQISKGIPVASNPGLAAKRAILREHVENRYAITVVGGRCCIYHLVCLLTELIWESVLPVFFSFPRPSAPFISTKAMGTMRGRSWATPPFFQFLLFPLPWNSGRLEQNCLDILRWERKSFDLPFSSHLHNHLLLPSNRLRILPRKILIFQRKNSLFFIGESMFFFEGSGMVGNFRTAWESRYFQRFP